MYRYMFLHKFYIYRCNDLFLFIKPFHKAYMIYIDHIVYIMEAITFFKIFYFYVKKISGYTEGCHSWIPIAN